MQNFEYSNPVKILFGKGQIAKLAAEIPAGVRILVTYGRGSVKRNGVFAQVEAALAGREFLEFGGIEPNPRFETLMQAVQMVRSERIGFLLAIGGGSVIDGTKFIAAAAPFNGDPWAILSAQAKVREAVPLGSVLTLPATGSEMNAFAVITRAETREKFAFSSPLVYPKFSVLDPEATFSLPPQQVANGVVDAFTHVMEQYLTYPADAPLQDRLAESILLTLIEEGPRTLAEPQNYAARANLMWAATMALNGIISVGVPQDWATHMIGHEITALCGLDHAQTLAIVLPNLLHVQRQMKAQKLLQYAERVWGIASGEPEERMSLAVEKTRTFFHRLGVPTRLSDYGIARDTLAEIPARFEQRRTVLGERQDITPLVVSKILDLAA
ncbi:MAG TPA: iron-containing alcohol dehydrogenase [Bryobacteraceae bacterium]|nr:iron-containing alcohol dehydrogenase [Bryobacteraceae bacterium]